MDPGPSTVNHDSGLQFFLFLVSLALSLLQFLRIGYIAHCLGLLAYRLRGNDDSGPFWLGVSLFPCLEYSSIFHQPPKRLPGTTNTQQEPDTRNHRPPSYSRNPSHCPSISNPPIQARKPPSLFPHPFPPPTSQPITRCALPPSWYFPPCGCLPAIVMEGFFLCLSKQLGTQSRTRFPGTEGIPTPGLSSRTWYPYIHAEPIGNSQSIRSRTSSTHPALYLQPVRSLQNSGIPIQQGGHSIHSLRVYGRYPPCPSPSPSLGTPETEKKAGTSRKSFQAPPQ